MGGLGALGMGGGNQGGTYGVLKSLGDKLGLSDAVLNEGKDAQTDAKPAGKAIQTWLRVNSSRIACVVCMVLFKATRQASRRCDSDIAACDFLQIFLCVLVFDFLQIFVCPPRVGDVSSPMLAGQAMQTQLKVPLCGFSCDVLMELIQINCHAC